MLGHGIHRLTRPLELDHRDRGTRWVAEDGTAPVVSGARCLTAWKAGRINGLDAWWTDVKLLQPFTAIYVGDERRSWPILPMQRFTDLDGQADTGFAFKKGPVRARYPDGAIDPRWRRREDIRITAYQLWFEAHLRIARIDARHRLVHFQAPSLGSLVDERSAYARFRVENVREALREPGTWYRDGDRLWYLPRPGEEMAAFAAEVPQLGRLLTITGSRTRPARDIRFEGIRFAHADYDRQPDDVGDVQAAHSVPGAVVLTWAEDCAFAGCSFSHLGGYGVQIGTACLRTTIAGCTLRDLGAGGIRIDHEEHKPHQAAVGSGFIAVRPEPQMVTICDCEISHIGRRFPSAVAILLGNAGWCRILRNHIHDVSYTALSLGWVWGYAPTRLIGTEVRGNRIERVNCDRLLSDNGAIYTLGRAPGGIIADNRIAGVHCHGYGGWGIYPDQGSSEWRITGNLVSGTDHAGLSIHFARALTIRRNVFLDAGEAQIALGRAEQHRSATFTGNLIGASRGRWSRVLASPSVQVLFTGNTLADARAPALPTERLAALQRQGQHRGTCSDDDGLCDLASCSPRPARFAAVVARAEAAGPRRRPRQGWLAAVPPLRPRPVIETCIERCGSAEPLGDGRTSVRWRICWRNPGMVTARLDCVLQSIGILRGPKRIRCRLSPGSERTVECTVIAHRDARLVALETRPLGLGAVPHLVFAAVGSAEASLTLGTDLAAATPLAIRYALSDEQAAVARLARSPSGIDLAVEVIDAAPRWGDKPWSASAVEMFAAPEDGGATSGQIIIRPGLPGRAAEAWHLRAGRLRPAPEVSIEQETRTGGYALRARIPASLLGIDPAKPFRAELAVSAVRQPGADAERASWCGAPAPHVDAVGMAVISL